MAAGANDGGFGLMGWIAGGGVALVAGVAGLYLWGVFDPETALDAPPADQTTQPARAAQADAENQPQQVPATATPADATPEPEVAAQGAAGSEPEPKAQESTSTQPAPGQDVVADPAPSLLAPGFDVVRVDTEGNTVIAGTGTPGSRVTIFVDGKTQASTVVDRSGAFVSLLTVLPSDTARVLTMTAELDGQQRHGDDQIILTPTARAEPERQIAEAQTEPGNPPPEDLAENSSAESEPALKVQPGQSGEGAVKPFGEAEVSPSPADIQVAQAETGPVAKAPAVPAPDKDTLITTTPDPANADPAGNTQTAASSPEPDRATTQTAEPETSKVAQAVPAQTEQPAAVTEDTGAQAAQETTTEPPEAAEMAQAQPTDPAGPADPTGPTTIASVPDPETQVAQAQPNVPDPSTDVTDPNATNESTLAQTGDDPVQTGQENVVIADATPETTADLQTRATPIPAKVQPPPAQADNAEIADTQSGDPGATQLATIDTAGIPAEDDPAPITVAIKPDTAPDAGTQAVAQVAQAEEPTEVAVAEPAPAEPAPVEPAPVEPAPVQPAQAADIVVALAEPVPAVEPSDQQPVEDRPTVAAVQPDALFESAIELTPEPLSEPAPIAVARPETTFEATPTPSIQSDPPVEIAAIAAPVPDLAQDGVLAPATPGDPALALAAPVAIADPDPAPVAPVAIADPPPPAAPAAPAPVTVLRAGADGIEVLQSGSPVPEVMDKIALDTISYSQAGEIQLSGRAQLQSVIRVYLDNKAVGDLVTDETGRWSGEVEDITPGIYTLRLDELGQGGDVLSRIETPFKRESPDVLRPPTDPSAVAGGNTADGGPTPLVRAVTVQRGDTLWAISRERYGEGVLYIRVFEANRRDIRDPDLIYPGQVFKLPE